MSDTGVVRLDATGTTTPFATPQLDTTQGELTSGPDGALWFTDPIGRYIGRLTTSGQVTRFALSHWPQGIAPGPDGSLWFTEPGDNQIGRITTSGAVTEFPLPTSHGTENGVYEEPLSIVEGSDGAMWFVEGNASPAGGRIGRITVSGRLTEFELPTPNARPWRIIAGIDGALWFTELSANQIGRITTSGIATEFKVSSSPNVGPVPIVQAPDGTVWFGEAALSPQGGTGSNQLGRLTPDGKVTLYPIPTQKDGNPLSMAITADGTLWISHNSGSLIQVQIRV